jgi:hypothetical protein
MPRLAFIPMMLLAAIAWLGAEGCAHADDSAALPSVAGGPQSCFLGTSNDARAEMIESATIFLGVVRPDGSLLSEGTGFVVEGRSGGPKIVTAAHVVDSDSDDYPADARLMAFFSDGSAIGRVEILISGLSHPGVVGGHDLVLDDVAVVDVGTFVSPEAQARFQRIEVLPIGAGGAILVGEASEPVAVAWGFSGAPAVDAAGRVVGVVTGADFRGHSTVELGSISDTEAGHPVLRKVTLPSQSLVVVEPLQAPQLVETLAPAVPMQAAEEIPAVIAGYPLASCAVTSTVLRSADTNAGAALFAKWRGVGPTGAWLLPPKLGAMHLPQ